MSSTISISLACIPSVVVTDIPFLKFDTCCLLRVHSNIVNNKRFLNDSSGICKTLAFKYCFSNYIAMYYLSGITNIVRGLIRLKYHLTGHEIICVVYMNLLMSLKGSKKFNPRSCINCTKFKTGSFLSRRKCFFCKIRYPCTSVQLTHPS